MIQTLFVWILIGFLFLILELGHPGLLFFISLSIGSISAALLVLLQMSFALQLASFFAGTLIAFSLLRWGLSKFHRSTQQTNVYALIGKQGTVTVPIESHAAGYVMIEGQTWLARSHANVPLSVSTPIVVLNVRGAHLIVGVLS